MIFFKILNVFLITIAVAIASVTFYTTFLFGEVTYAQILFNVVVGNPLSMLTPPILLGGLLIFVIIILTSYCSGKILNYFNCSKIWFFSVAIFGVTCFSIYYANSTFQIYNYYTQKKSDWFERNYVKINVENISQNEKPNLILIMLESIEAGYADADIYGENLIASFQELNPNIVFSGYKKTPGGYYTMDGVVAMQTGVPLLKLPVNIHNIHASKNVFSILKNTPGIFEYLKINGYKTNAFFGSNEGFTAQDLFLKSHGFEVVVGSETWWQKGYPMNVENGGFCAPNCYSDKFLWQRMKEWFSIKQNTIGPFAVLIETLDTHAPNGFNHKEFDLYYDVRDAIKESTWLVTNFIKWAKDQPWFENTVIVLVGDHPWQDGNNKFSKFTKLSSNRGVYFSILNAPGYRDQKKSVFRSFSAVDIAPTILGAMGFNFSGIDYSGDLVKNRIGLGVNLLSDEKTLIEEQGLEYILDQMNNYQSDFYIELYH